MKKTKMTTDCPFCRRKIENWDYDEASPFQCPLCFKEITKRDLKRVSLESYQFDNRKDYREEKEDIEEKFKRLMSFSYQGRG